MGFEVISAANIRIIAILCHSVVGGMIVNSSEESDASVFGYSTFRYRASQNLSSC